MALIVVTLVMNTRQYQFYPITKWVLYFILLFSFLFPLTARPHEKILRVGVAPGEPFVIVKDNKYSGISVDLWKYLAHNLNIKYQFIPMSEHIDDDVMQLAKGQVDVLIGPVISTAERVKLADFTRPYYLDQIRVVVPIKTVSFTRILLAISNSALSSVVLFIVCFFIIYIHIFWFFEGRKGYMGIKPTYWSGIKTAFWIHTLGISFNQLPTHTYTKLFRLVWTIVVLLLLSVVTATMTSSLTIALSNNFSKEDVLSDLKYERLTGVINTAPYDIAKEASLDIKPVNSRTEGIDLLLKGYVAGFVDYASIADYYMKEHALGRKLTLAHVIIQQNTFAIALPLNSPIRHQINIQLAILQSMGQTYFLCKKYLSEESAKYCNI